MLLALLAKDLKRLLASLLSCLLLQGLDPGGFSSPGIGFSLGSGIGFSLCLRLGKTLLLLLLQLLLLLPLLLLHRNLLCLHLLLLPLLGLHRRLALSRQLVGLRLGCPGLLVSRLLGAVVLPSPASAHGQTPILRPAPAAAGVPPVLIFRLLFGLSFLVTAAVVWAPVGTASDVLAVTA